MMKKHIFILLSLFILIFGLIAVQAEEKSGSWKEVLQLVVKHPSNLAGFLNETQGITVGYAGEIHYTKDAGKTWPNAVNSSFCRFGLDIVNDKLAWNCGNAGHVRMSTDGGETWSAVSGFGDMEPDQCRFLSFVDDKNGWIASPYRFAITADGGKTWNELDSPAGNKDTAAVFLRTPNEGYMLDVSGNLYMTEDGCKTWSVRTLPLGGQKILNSRCPVAAIQFSDVNHGSIIISQKGTICSYVTADGGKTWAKELISDKYSGFLYLTHDGKTLTVTSKKNAAMSKDEAVVTVLSR